MFKDRYNLTQAVLNGTKTMTRRLVGDRMTDDDIKAYLNGYTELANKCAYYKIGEVVAVAQCYETLANNGYLNEMTTPANNAVGCEFKKDYCNRGWSNKMFVKPALMPHQIRITNIKVERLQDISDEDCLKEGVECYLDIIAEKGASKYEKHAEEECWIAGGDGENHYDQSISYCRNCAEKIAKKENKEKGYGEWDDYYHRDGGWGQEHDRSSLSCEECGKPLLFSYIPTFFDDDIEGLCLDDISDLYLLDQMLQDCDDEIREKAIQRLVRPSFASLIDAVSGKGTWELNPYVFAYTFELIK